MEVIAVDEQICRRILNHRPYASIDEALDKLKQSGPLECESIAAVFAEKCWVNPCKYVAMGKMLQCWENTKLHLLGGADNIVRAWFGEPGRRWEEIPMGT